MPVPITKRVRDYLEDSPQYKRAERIDWSRWASRVQLQSDEMLLGVYHNAPDQVMDSIAVTDRGIYYVAAEAIHFVAYVDIQSIDWPVRDKEFLRENPDKRGLVLTRKNGEVITIPITGSVGRGADMASFHSFLLGACQTLDIIARKQNEDR